MEWLFRKIAEAYSSVPGLPTFHGLELYGIDGSHLRVQDSDETSSSSGSRATAVAAGMPAIPRPGSRFC